jgi:hypothetical protein
MVLALIVVASAFAAEVSRDEYKEAAEPICKRNTQANERILASVRTEVKQGKLKTAAAKFTKASVELEKTVGELKKIQQPSADNARLSGWFSLLGVEAELFAAAGSKLKAGDKPGAEHIVSKLTQNANKANLEVLPFSFGYCRLEPAKFT